MFYWQKSCWRRWYSKLFSIPANIQIFKRVLGVVTGNYIRFWKSKGLSDENITAPTTSDYKLNPQLGYYGTKTRVWFKTDRSFLKQDKVAFNHGKVVNIYIVYELIKIAVIGSCDNYPTLQNLVQ